MFCGREHELASLKSLLEKENSSLVLVKGRRRIGKSTLVKEFAARNKMPIYEFQGLFPRKGITKKSQFNQFAVLLEQYFNFPKLQINDWTHAFQVLSQCTINKKCVILLDEVSWMAQGDKDYAGKLKIAWDLHFSHHKKLILFVCGSVTFWIENNIAKNTGFAGRISQDIHLKELPLNVCKTLLKDTSLTSRELIRWLSITGGVPKYLIETPKRSTLHSNLIKLCYSPSGFLFQEFEIIFSETFGKRYKIYKKILEALLNKPLEPHDLAKKINMQLNSDFSEYIYDLELSGFINREYNWDFKKFLDKKRKISYLKISDNYCRFYLKYIAPYQERLQKMPLKITDSLSFINWDTILGLQYENIVKNNLDEILRQLEIPNGDVVQLGGYFQRQNSKQKGVQFDLIIQTKNNLLWLGEIKCRKQINSTVTKEMKKKLSHLKKPKQMAINPFLIYSGDIDETIVDDTFWKKIINFE